MSTETPAQVPHPVFRPDSYRPDTPALRQAFTTLRRETSALMEAGQYDEARQCFEAHLAVRPHLPQTDYLHYMQALFQTGRAALVAQLLGPLVGPQQALEHNDSATGLFIEALAKSGNARAARKHLRARRGPAGANAL